MTTVQIESFTSKKYEKIAHNDVKLPRLYAEVNLSMAKVEVMAQATVLNRLIYSKIMFFVRKWQKNYEKYQKVYILLCNTKCYNGSQKSMISGTLKITGDF